MTGLVNKAMSGCSCLLFGTWCPPNLIDSLGHHDKEHSCLYVSVYFLEQGSCYTFLVTCFCSDQNRELWVKVNECGVFQMFFVHSLPICNQHLSFSRLLKGLSLLYSWV